MPEARLDVIALQGIGEVAAGADLAGMLFAAAAELRAGDVLAVSSKVVSKAAGLTAPADRRDAVVEAETVRVVAERRTPRGLASVVESVAGPVMAAAGVDASNTAAGTVLLLPADPDQAARELRSALVALGAPLLAVVVTDTAGRAWRTGQTDFALGCAGLQVVDDLRGSADANGAPLEVTERAIADEVAAAADLVKGKASGVPAAIVRGLAAFVTEDDGPGAAALLREPSSDWFKLGHVEAVRASLGIPHGAVEAPSVMPESLQHRAQRALNVALALFSETPGGFDGVVVTNGDDCLITVMAAEEFLSGWLVARLMTALWCEDLVGALEHDPVQHVSQVIVTAR